MERRLHGDRNGIGKTSMGVRSQPIPGARAYCTVGSGSTNPRQPLRRRSRVREVVSGAGPGEASRRDDASPTPVDAGYVLVTH